MLRLGGAAPGERGARVRPRSSPKKAALAGAALFQLQLPRGIDYRSRDRSIIAPEIQPTKAKLAAHASQCPANRPRTRPTPAPAKVPHPEKAPASCFGGCGEFLLESMGVDFRSRFRDHDGAGAPGGAPDAWRRGEIARPILLPIEPPQILSSTVPTSEGRG